MPVEYEITEPQFEIMGLDAPVCGFIAGYGAGKSTALVLRALRLVKRDSTAILVAAPTFDLLTLVLLPEFEVWLERFGMRYKLNNSRHTIDIHGYGTIIMRSLDQPGRIVGFSVGHALVDELDILSAPDALEAYHKVLARCRLRLPEGRQNSLAIFSTPEGFKTCYQVLVVDPAPGTKLVRAPTYSNPWLPKDYVEKLRANYPAALAEAYIEGRFVNLLTGNCYPEFSRVENATDATLSWEDETILHVGMDFNVANQAVLCAHKTRTGLDVVKEFVKVRDTPQACRLLRDFAGPDRPVVIYPDATGEKRNTTNATTTDLTQLKAAGFIVKANASNPRVRDRVNSVNVLIGGNGAPRRLRVNVEQCPMLVRSLETQAWDDNGEPEKPGGPLDYSHCNDGLGYMVHWLYPAARPVSRAVGERPKVAA